jgi:hypothetical protein
MSVSRRICLAIALTLVAALIGGCGARLFAKKADAGMRQPRVSTPQEGRHRASAQHGVRREASAPAGEQRQELDELLSIQ